MVRTECYVHQRVEQHSLIFVNIMHKGKGMYYTMVQGIESFLFLNFNAAHDIKSLELKYLIPP